MKFNVVIGNPPYSHGIDLDFVHLSYKICKDYIVMLTPAKWQSIQDNAIVQSKTINYGEFRKLYNKHIKYICFYPCCKELFDILQADGITYYIIDKNNTYDKCIIENKSKYIDIFSSISNRSILNEETLFNIGAEIIQYLEPYNKFDFGYIKGKRYYVYTSKRVAGGGLSTVESSNNTYFVGVSEIFDNLTNKYLPDNLYDNYTLSFESDSIDECKSFISWLNTRFTRFFVAIYVSKLTGLISKHTFRFVPAPLLKEDGTYNWDIQYTDKILYNYYNVPKKYIDIMELIVKERK